MASKSKSKQFLRLPLGNIINRSQPLKIGKEIRLKKLLAEVCIKQNKKYVNLNYGKQPMQSQSKKPLKLKNPKIVISKNKKTKVTLKPYIPLQSNLTKRMIVEYGIDFEASLSSNNGLNSPSNPLKYHDISKELRTRMVNWMIEVTNIFETQHQTFFTAVTIMDLFYANSNKIFSSQDIHLTGMVSMFIASKYLDYSHLSMNKLVHDIGHNSFSVRQIKDKEKEIMQTLGFCIIFATILTYLDYFIQSFMFVNPQLTTKQTNILNKIKKLSIYFGKMSLYEYSMLKYRYVLVSRIVL